MLDFILFILTYGYAIIDTIFFVTGKLLVKIFTFNRLDFDFSDKNTRGSTIFVGAIFYIVTIVLLYLFR
jgi:hypothetical protein